jgi:hypothetical protein
LRTRLVQQDRRDRAPVDERNEVKKCAGSTAFVRPHRVKSSKKKGTMTSFDDPTEQPEPLWQTILGCLFLALIFGLALLI